MHQHVAHPPGPEPSPGLIDNISDSLLNAFARVRKPDDRFLSMREEVDKFEDGLQVSERLWTRVRGRTSGKSYFCPPPLLHLRLNKTEILNLVKTSPQIIMISLWPSRVLDF